MSRSRWPTRSALWFWRLMHRIDEDLLLLVPEDRLAAEALHIKAMFQRNITDATTKAVWESRLSQIVGQLNPVPPQPPQTAAIDDASRHVLRGALRLVNEATDSGFRIFAITTYIQLFSAALLVATFALGFLIYREHGDLMSNPADPLPTGLVLLLGAAGAIVANMTSDSPSLVPAGQVRISLLYYLIVTPAIGAITALLLLAVDHSQLLFSVVDDASTRATAASSAPVKDRRSPNRSTVRADDIGVRRASSVASSSIAPWASCASACSARQKRRRQRRRWRKPQVGPRAPPETSADGGAMTAPQTSQEPTLHSSDTPQSPVEEHDMLSSRSAKNEVDRAVEARERGRARPPSSTLVWSQGGGRARSGSQTGGPGQDDRRASSRDELLRYRRPRVGQDDRFAERRVRDRERPYVQRVLERCRRTGGRSRRGEGTGGAHGRRLSTRGVGRVARSARHGVLARRAKAHDPSRSEFRDCAPCRSETRRWRERRD